MNARESVARLPESVRRVVARDPAVKLSLDEGVPLEEALSGAEWTKRWARGCDDPVQPEVLKLVLKHYASAPFEPERLEKLAEEEGGWTGAQARVALARLRRSGILFAVRKAWGDRLLYMPDDTVRLWQPLLLPAGCRRLTGDESRAVEVLTTRCGVPLGLGLLAAWHEIGRRPIPATGRGGPNRAALGRLAATMGWRSDGLALWPVPRPYPDAPPQAALAIDLGVEAGVLVSDSHSIRIRPEGIEGWLILSPEAAERRLAEIVFARYCSADPALHLTASAVLALENGWHDAGRLAEWQSPEELDRKLGALEAIGWLERGRCGGREVIRRTTGCGRPEKTAGRASSEREPLVVQPDGEIFAPPGIGLRLRWALSDLAELRTADAMFVYRLTKESCAEGYRAGYTAEGAIALLEEASGEPLPEPVIASIRDWFAPLGKFKLMQATILRTDEDMAKTIADDPELSELLAERLGERDYLVDPERVRALADKLARLGYPLEQAGESRFAGRTAPIAATKKEMRPDEGAAEDGPGRLSSSSATASSSRSPSLSLRTGKPAEDGRRRLGGAALFEADRTLPAAEDLFPGLGDIPAAWITRPRKYHPSTAKELLLRAIEWRTAVRLEADGCERLFVPKTVREEGRGWTASGRWGPGQGPRSAPEERGNPAPDGALTAQEVGGIMIVLPEWEEFETD